MRGTKAKKIRQMYTRMLRREILNQLNVLRPKPKWMPMFMWRLIYKIVFKK